MNPTASLKQAIAVVRGMVTPYDRIRLSRFGSHDPKLFFAEVFDSPRTLVQSREGGRVVEHELIHGVCLMAPHIHLLKCSRRELVVPQTRRLWEALVDRRVTRGSRFVQTIVDQAYIEGYPGFSLDEMVKMVLRWIVMDWVGVSIKQMKLHSVWLSGYSRDVEAPTSGMLDLPGYLGSVRYRTWLLRKLRDRRVRRDCPYSPAEILGESWLLGVKRGAPSMEKTDQKEAAMDYLKHMSVPRGITGPYRDLIIGALIRTTEEVFGLNVEEVPKSPFVPSQRAGYKAAIWTGGILGSIVRNDPSLLEERCDLDATWTGEEKVTVSARRFDHEKSFSVLEGEGKFGNGRLADCQIYMIYEPLKLRTISAGTPELYGNMQPLLDHMRAGMRKHEVFGLTRKENNSAWLGNRLNAGPAEKSTWTLFNSGDYQQSTNDLSMEVTDIIRRVAFDGRMFELVKAALGAQVLHWDKDNQCEQMRGQLMGSPLSFPVLCVANAALKRLAYQIVYDKWWDKPLDFFPMAINGDDIVARINLMVYQVWLELLDAVGWRLSPGKSYLHETLAQVNSQTMKVQWVKGRVVLSEPIPYVNHGFISQMGKATSPVDDTPLEAMSFEWRKRFDSFGRLPTGMRIRAEEVMLRNLRRTANELCKDGWTPFVFEPMNPKHLGGFGISDTIVDPDVAWKHLCSRKRKVASFEEKLARDPEFDQPPPAEPFLTLTPKASRKPRPGEMLEILMEDLESYVDKLTALDPRAPAGYVDPILRREPMTLVDVALHRLNQDRMCLVNA